MLTMLTMSPEPPFGQHHLCFRDFEKELTLFDMSVSPLVLQVDGCISRFRGAWPVRRDLQDLQKLIMLSPGIHFYKWRSSYFARHVIFGMLDLLNMEDYKPLILATDGHALHRGSIFDRRR